MNKSMAFSMVLVMSGCLAGRPIGDPQLVLPAGPTTPGGPTGPADDGHEQPCGRPPTSSYRAIHVKDQAWNIGDDLVLIFKKDLVSNQCAMVELERLPAPTFSQRIALPEGGIETNVIEAWDDAAKCDESNVPSATPSKGFSGVSQGVLDWDQVGSAMPCRLSGRFSVDWFGENAGSELFTFEDLTVENLTGAPDGCTP